MDYSQFFVTIITLCFFATIICLVAIVYGQKDIAALALRLFGKVVKTEPPQDEPEAKPN